MKLVNQTIVVDFFKAIWPVHEKRAVHIEMLARAESCPVSAMVGWDIKTQTWRILIDESLEPKKMLLHLFHELGHIHFGDVTTKDIGDWDADRRVFTGAGTYGTAIRQHFWATEGHKAEVQRQEKRVNDWAVELHKQWWPVLETVERFGEKANTIMGRL